MRLWLVRLLGLVVKELRQTSRDRRVLALLVGVPIIQIVVFGFAVNLDVDRVPTIVVDQDDTARSRADTDELLADGTLRRLRPERSLPAALASLVTGEATLVVVLPDGYARDRGRGAPVVVQVISNGTDPTRSGVAVGMVSAFFTALGPEQREPLVADVLGRDAPGSATAGAVVSVTPRLFHNPGLETAWYMVPGVLAILLLLVTTIVSAMGLAREREAGTMEQVLVTPISESALILGKTLPFALVGLVDFGLALAVGAWTFGLPLRADFALLLVATVVYLLALLGLGLLVASSSQNQQQAFMGGFLVMLPTTLLSGVMTPVRSMPEWLQPVTLLNPLRHYATVLRAALLEGAGFLDMLPELLALAALATVILVSAIFTFRRTLT